MKEPRLARGAIRREIVFPGMTLGLIRHRFMEGQDNYLIGGNVCNAFALGELGSTEDFFLVGAEPETDSGYPMLTENILDS